MKYRKRFLCAALAAMLLAGCSGRPADLREGGGASPAPSYQASAPAASSAGDVVFTDALGYQVELHSWQRVVSLYGSFAETWVLAGGALAGTTSDAVEERGLVLGDHVAIVGSVKNPGFEEILAAQPDFVLASTKPSADVELMPTLENAGIPTAYFDVSSFEDYLRMLEICTRITGCEDRYEQYGTLVQEQVDAAIASAQGKQGPTVLYLRATGSSCKVKNSQNTVLGEMLADLGCTNIADSDESLLETLSMEAILQADPECIFIVLQGSDQEKARKNSANYGENITKKN